MYHSRKKGFTMVELVIVIAVIAILAAILIPTFTNLIRKANEASALANARNAANQLLADLLARGDDAKDLVIFNQKGDDIYVYGYSAEAGRVLAYYGNPVDAKSIDGETLEDRAEKLLEKMLANGELTLRTPRPTETDWWHPSKMEEVVTGLNFKPEEMVLRADYKIVLARFEKGGQPEHTCTAADLDKIDEVKPTCMTQGYPAYWVCRVCGKAYHDATATQPVSADDPLVATDINPDAHQLGAWQHDENKHWQVCALNPEHTHLNEAAHTGNPCTVCGYSTGGNTPTSPAGKKNGLVDGYYYKDDELFTGTIEDGGTEYKFENGRLVITDTYVINEVGNNNPMYGAYYDVEHTIKAITNAAYATKEIYVDTEAFVENSPGLQCKQKIVVEDATYRAIRAQLTSPDFGDGTTVDASSTLSSIIKGWSAADLQNYLLANGDTQSSTIPYIIGSDDYTAFLSSVYSSGTVSQKTQQYLSDYSTGVISKTYTQYLVEKYGAFATWTYEDALSFINADGNCIEVDGNRVSQVEPELIEFILKTFYLAAYNNSHVAIYDQSGTIVNAQSVGTFYGINYSKIYYTFVGYGNLLNYSNDEGVAAIEILTPMASNYWNGRDVCSPAMRIVIATK